MTAKVILNPYAGRWKALKRREEAELALKNAGIEFDLVVSAHPGHGKELAAQATRDGFNPIISAGGDGSNSEVINGIAQVCLNGQSQPHPPIPNFGILPLGSANDLVANLKLPKDLQSAANLIAAGNTRAMDLCKVNGRLFDNNAAIGLEPYITMKQERIQRIRGVLRYLIATLQGIADKPEWTMQLTWESGSYSGPISLVTVGNNPRTGGLFYVTPHADPFDGLLTFVYGWVRTRRQMLQVLPMLMRSGTGNYVEHPAIHEVHSPWLRVHSDHPTPMHADGEIQSPAIQDVEYSVIPQCLPVLMT